MKLEPIDGEPQFAEAAPQAPRAILEPLEGEPDIPSPAPESVPMSKSFLERLMQDTKQGRILTEIGKGAAAGWGNEPLGLSDENTQKLRELGVFRNPKEPNVRPMLRLFNEAWLTPAAKAGDAFVRLMQAGTFAAAGGISKMFVEEGAVDEDKEARFRRDMVGMLDTIGLLTAGNPQTTLSRVRRGPQGQVFDEPIGGIPRTKADFENTTLAITDGTKMPAVDAKLERLYNEKGVLPQEVFGDANENPIVKQDLLSKTGKLPEQYGPPPPPTDITFRTPEPPQPPRGAGITREEYAGAMDKVLANVSVGEAEAGRGWTWKRFYTNMVDRLYPIFTDTRVKRDLEVYEDPYALSRLYAGWTAKADHMIHTATYDFNTLKNNGASLEDVLKPFKKDLDPFRAFIVSARAAEMEIRGFKSGFDPDAINIVGRARTKEMEQAFEQLVDYQNRISKQLRDSGILSSKAYDGMLEQNRLFIPFHKVAESVLDHPILTASGKGSMQATNPIKRLTGADIRITDPLESIIKNTFVLTAMAERNQVGLRIIDRLLELDKAIPEEGMVKKNLPAVIEPQNRKAVGDWLRHGEGKVADELADEIAQWTMPVGEGEIAVYRNGRREVYAVDTDLARAFKQMDRDTLSTLERILSMPARGLRAGALAAPEFGPKHIFRDFFYAAASMAKGVYTPVDTARAMFGMFFYKDRHILGLPVYKGDKFLGAFDITKDADFHNWIKGGGGDVSVVALDRNRLQATLNDITAKTGLMTRAWNVVIDPNATYLQKGGAVLGLPFQAGGKFIIHPLQVATEIAMSVHHFAGYKKAIRRIEQENAEFNRANGNVGPLVKVEDMNGQMIVRDGVSLQEAIAAQQKALLEPSASKKTILEAAFAARETSVDMTRIGAKMTAYNMISAFANSKIQDIDKIVRLFKDQPVRTSMVTLGGITVPSLLLWWANKDDSRYNSLPAWQKDLFWIIPTDKWEKASPQDASLRPTDQVRLVNGEFYVNNGTIFRLPKPFSLGVVFGSLPERLMEKYYKENPKAFAGFFDSLKDSIVGDVMPNAFIPSYEQAMNQSLFNGSTVIPHSQEKLLPEYQYTAYTTETAKALGKLFSAFPGISQYRTDPDSYGFGGTARALSSPALIENYIRGWTSSLGMYALGALDLGLRKAGIVDSPTKPDWTFADVPVVKAFLIRYPNSTTQNISTFFEKFEVNKRYYDTYLAKAKEGDVEAMERVKAMGGDKIFAQLGDMRKSLTAQYEAIRQTNALTAKGEIKPYEARQLIDSLYYGLIQSGDAAMAALNQVENIRVQPSP